MLRQFLYLDRDLVRDFLAQLEGGVYDESRERRSEEGRKGVGGKAALGPVSGSAERGRSSQAESESVVRQTAASEFDRLYRSLEENELQIYDTIDAGFDDLPVRRKDIIEIDARVKLSGVRSLLDMMKGFTQLAPLIDAMGADAGIDADTLAGITAMSALSSDSAPTPIIGRVPGDAGVQVGLELSASGVLTDQWDCDATILLKVQRVLRKDDRILVGDPLGGLLTALPKEQREEFAELMRSDDLERAGAGETEVTYPGWIGTPIAIFR